MHSTYLFVPLTLAADSIHCEVARLEEFSVIDTE